MTYDARQITNWFIQRAASDGKVFSIVSLLKLAYISYGWYLETKNETLFRNRIEAWSSGPVIPDICKTFRSQGINSRQVIPEYKMVTEPEDVDFLEQIYNIYGQIPYDQLFRLTQESGSPWETARKWGGQYAEIPDEIIKAHYIVKRNLSLQSCA